MNNQILLGLVTIGLVASVVGVGTYAYFSDTETSAGNTMTAGTLDLWIGTPDETGEIDWMNGPDVGPVVVANDLKPSWTTVLSDKIYLKVVDNPAKLYKKITNIECNQGTYPQPEPEVDEERGMSPDDLTCSVPEGVVPGKCDIDEYTWFDMTVSGVVCLPMFEDDTGLYHVGDLEDRWIYLGTIKPGEVMDVVQSFHLDAGVTNWAQNDECTFDEEFWALQINDETTPEEPVYCWTPTSP